MLDTPEQLELISKFINWELTASPMDKFIYYTGFSLTDSIMSLDIKEVTWKFAVEGKIYLLQARSKSWKLFDFIAIKATNPPVIKLVPLNDEQYRNSHGMRKH